MLSVFPELLNFQLIGVFIVRIAIGVSLFYLATEILFNKRDLILSNLKSFNETINKSLLWVFGIVTLLSSGFLIIGFLIQISAPISAYLFLNIMLLDKKLKILEQSRMFYFIMATISFSLIFLGPGFLSVDLPL